MYTNKYINFIFLIIATILLFLRKRININSNTLFIIISYLIILNFIQFLLHLEISNDQDIKLKINNIFSSNKDCSFNNKLLTFINQGLYLFQPYILLLIFQLFDKNLYNKNIYNYLKLLVFVLCIFNSILFYFNHYNCIINDNLDINCKYLCTLNINNDLEESINNNSSNYNYITFINILIVILTLFMMNYKITVLYLVYMVIIYILNNRIKFIYKGENGIFISGISLFFYICLLLRKYLYTDENIWKRPKGIFKLFDKRY